MNFEVIFHGNPNGQSICGSDLGPQEEKYIESFYISVSNNEAPHLLVETRLSPTPYCYYHYLIYQNIIGADNRPKAYFGLTLRLDVVWIDFANAYRILDWLYNNFIAGHILNPCGMNMKYSVSDLHSCESIFNSIQNELLRMFQISIRKNDISPISSTERTGTTSKHNLLDISKEQFKQDLLSGKKVKLSPYYPSTGIQNELQNLRRDLASTRQQANNNTNSLRQQLQLANQQINQLHAQNERNHKELQEKRRRALTNQELIDIRNLATQLKEPITRLSSILNDQKTRPNTSTKTRKLNRKRITIISFCLIIALIIILLIIYFV